MSSPHVAGAIAQMMSCKGKLTPAQVETQLDAKAIAGAMSNEQGGQDLFLCSDFNDADGNVCCNRPEKPFVQLEFIRCSGTLSEYGATWLAGDSTPVTQWDVDIAYSGGSTWYAWYNGTNTSKLLSFNGSSTRLRVRGINAHGAGEFAYTGWAFDTCTGSGGGDPL